jgi:hypothetical protein
MANTGRGRKPIKPGADQRMVDGKNFVSPTKFATFWAGLPSMMGASLRLVDRYNDLPARYKQNIDIVDGPFNRKEGDEPALNDVEIDDVIAFLKTLTDGYRSEQPDDSTKRAAR